MKDLMGRELSVGDVVVVAPKNYRGLIKATIESFTPKQVRLVYFNHNNYLVHYLVPPEFVTKVSLKTDGMVHCLCNESLG